VFPVELFAVLAVVRQAVDAAAVGRTSGEILSLLGTFSRQWQAFCGSLDKVGRALDGADRAFRELAGTRRRALERPLLRVEELRRQRGLPAADLPDEDALDPDGLRLVEARPPPRAARA